MAEASIPIDLTNPGQVFACLGFVESAEVLLGEARGGFDCQTAFNIDPRSACKVDPPEWHGGGCPGSQ